MSGPITFTDPLGLAVEFICRPLDGFPKDGPKHCFIYITCKKEGWERVLSMFGDPATGTFPSQGYKHTYRLDFPGRNPTNARDVMRDDPRSKSNNFRATVPVPEGCDEEKCEFEKKVWERFKKFPSGNVPYSVAGPNSNTFARDLVGGYIPPGLTGAPGVNFGTPTPDVPAFGP